MKNKIDTCITQFDLTKMGIVEREEERKIRSLYIR